MYIDKVHPTLREILLYMVDLKFGVAFDLALPGGRLRIHWGLGLPCGRARMLWGLERHIMRG